MTTDRELMQQALDALITAELDGNCEYGATEALRARLAQPEQRSEQWWRHEVSNAWAEGYEKGRLQREWQGLTQEDKREIIDETEPEDRGYVMALVEAKLKEKNT